MPKSNFKKVEKLLLETLTQLLIKRIREYAERCTEPDFNPNQDEGVRFVDLTRSRKQVVQALRSDLRKLLQKDKGMLKKLGVTREELLHVIDDPSALSKEEWEQVKKLKVLTEKYREQLLAPLEKEMNTEIVEGQRIEHVNKRFNVRDGWLPLH